MELISKDRARKVILEDLNYHTEVFVTEDILAIAFPEQTPYNEAITIFAFVTQGKDSPPLTFDELIRQFCRANNLTFQMFPEKREGRFRKRGLQ